MSQATARHILVDSEDKCLDLKKQIADGGDFAALASEHSSCPSGKQGGDLGSFGPGMMVPEFDKVVFSADVVGAIQVAKKTTFFIAACGAGIGKGIMSPNGILL